MPTIYGRNYLTSMLIVMDFEMPPGPPAFVGTVAVTVTTEGPKGVEVFPEGGRASESVADFAPPPQLSKPAAAITSRTRRACAGSLFPPDVSLHISRKPPSERPKSAASIHTEAGQP